MVPKDPIFGKLLKRHGDLIWRYHDHDTLLENQADEDLTEADRNLAWKEFESEETKGPHQKSTTISAAVGVKSGELVTTATAPLAQDMIKTTASTTKKNEQNSVQVVSGSSGADESVSQSQNKENSTCSSGSEDNEEETVSYQPFRRKK